MKRFFIIYIWVFVMLWGCKKTNSFVEQTKPNEQQVTLRLLMPQQDNTKMDTYAISEVNQNTILTLDVLAFRIADGKEYYAYYKRGVLLRPNPGATEIDFHVDLLKSTDSYRFVLIANAATQLQTALSGLPANVEKETLMSLITYSITFKWNASSPSNFTPLPMWGESGVIPGVNTNTAGFGVSMLRSLAAIDVSVSANDFVMTQVSVYNQPSKGLVAPVRENYDAGTHTVTAPSIQTGSTSLGTQRYASGAKGLLNEIFLFESAAPASTGLSTATALVIAGKYAGSNSDTYYRIDLTDDNGKPLPILRNHRYRIEITRAHGPGFSTEAQAWASKPTGMTATVTAWNEITMADTNVPPQYYLKVSITKVKVNGLSGELIFDIRTNAPNPTLVLPSWLLPNQENKQGDKITYKLNVSRNPSSTLKRDAKINVQVGRLTRVINVTQDGRPIDLGSGYDFYLYATDIEGTGHWHDAANVEYGNVSFLDASETQRDPPYPKSCVAQLGPGYRLPTIEELRQIIPSDKPGQDIINEIIVADKGIPISSGIRSNLYMSSSTWPSQIGSFLGIWNDRMQDDYPKFFSQGFWNLSTRCVISK